MWGGGQEDLRGVADSARGIYAVRGSTADVSSTELLRLVRSAEGVTEGQLAHMCPPSVAR